MILAAGLGTRLRPLTDELPKALVAVAGVPMLERVARRLIAAGAERLVVNVHHHADRVEAFLRERDGFGVPVRISREPEAPLDTGGALRAAAPLFERSAPFFLHNVDVVSDADLGGMYRTHADAAAADPSVLATLAVARRSTSRPLLVDEEGVFGVADRRTGWSRRARPPRGPTRELGFAGIHVIDPGLLGLLDESGAFPIWDPYFRLVEAGRRLLPHDITGAAWHDVGSPERLEEARRWLGDR